MTALLMGCGNSRAKKVQIPSIGADWSRPLITMDMDPGCGADVVHDMEERPFPFPDAHFDEIAAYDALEHIGRQGDWRGFFDEFAEYWRILKPGGFFSILVPVGRDALADIGHTRFFHDCYFRFLDQDWYARSLANGESVTDYRWYWDRCFKVHAASSVEDHHLAVVLRKSDGE